MSLTIILVLFAVICAVLFFKVMGFLMRIAVIALLAGVGYWYLAPHFGWPPLPF